MRSSVVIASYRPDEWLRMAVESVVDSADEVIVVDNASAGGAVGALATPAGARVIRSDRNRGFAGGINLGLERASGDVIAFLNDDAVAASGWIDAATSILADGAVGAVGPKILLHRRYAAVVFDDEPWWSPGDPRRLGRQLRSVVVDNRDVLDELVGGVHRLERSDGDQWRWTTGRDEVYIPMDGDAEPTSIVVDGMAVRPTRTVDLVNNAGSYLSAEGHGGDRGSDTPDDGQFDERRSCFAVCGAALVTTREVLDRVGSLESRFFAYYEDLDWSWRVRLAGLEIVYDPSVVVRHRRGATSGGEVAPATRRMAAANRFEMLARNAPLRVVRRQLRRTLEAGNPAGMPRLAAGRTARGLLDRPRLRRRRTLTPSEVWRQWAGRDETWVHEGRSGGTVTVPPPLRFED